ncbi:hypothetical protein SNARM312S_00015 [Streptomyces narbonensis]
MLLTVTMEPEGIPRHLTNAPNRVYYFDIGTGTWHGKATFRVTSWRRLRRSRIGLTNKLLVTAMHVVERLTGAPKQESTIVAKPNEGEFGQDDNVVRISKFGVTLYLLEERYVLHSDGIGVTVLGDERLGPVPRLLTRSFTYSRRSATRGWPRPTSCRCSEPCGPRTTGSHPTARASSRNWCATGAGRPRKPA